MGWKERERCVLGVRRFVVVDDSMLPALVEGDGLVAMGTSRARPGQLRVFQHPDRPGMWLVKRVTEVTSDGQMTVASDNAEATRADSRTFGSLPVEGSYRVLLRVPQRWM